MNIPDRIDGRGVVIEDLLKALMEVFVASRMEEMTMDVLVSARDDAAKVKAYSSMSGYVCSVSREGDDYVVKLTGSYCGC